jgi:hypothetical protein
MRNLHVVGVRPNFIAQVILQDLAGMGWTEKHA